MMGDFIPFNAPGLVGGEFAAMQEAVERRHTAADGEFTRRCAGLLREETGAAEVLLTTSGTAALEMMALLLEARPGDEVIVPSFAFVSCANAFALRGMRVRFADVEEETLNLCPASVEALLGPRTRAVLALHYGGLACDTIRLEELARRVGADLLEDNAHGLFGRDGEQPLGSRGRWTALSFHETKNFSCGEGGALLLRRAADIEAARILRDKGTDRAAFLSGQRDKYTWVGLGSSYGMADILAAHLWVQLKQRRILQERRRELWMRYWEGLREWATGRGVGLPPERAGRESTHHVFYLRWPDRATRDAFLRHLREAGILAVFHYQPLHLSPMGRALGGREGDCPVAERAGEGLVRLPLFHGLRRESQERVLDVVRSFPAGGGR
jgi:dTDP-4-amino-4,6-dideoxygalactose transaminase